MNTSFSQSDMDMADSCSEAAPGRAVEWADVLSWEGVEEEGHELGVVTDVTEQSRTTKTHHSDVCTCTVVSVSTSWVHSRYFTFTMITFHVHNSLTMVNMY